jgi:hypothetical protein
VNRSDLATGLRVTGAVAALLLLTGVLQSSMWIVLAGLSLAAVGRALVTTDRNSLILVGISLVVLCAAVVALSLRWNTLDAASVRGTQAVLGPTLLVGPTIVATGAWIATFAATLAVGVWLAALPLGSELRDRSVAIGELFVLALAVAVPAWGPVAAGDPDMGVDLLGVLAATAIIGAAGFGMATVVRGRNLVWISTGASAVGVLVGAVLLSRAG